jgi:hypothetical protein
MARRGNPNWSCQPGLCLRSPLLSLTPRYFSLFPDARQAYTRTAPKSPPALFQPIVDQLRSQYEHNAQPDDDPFAHAKRLAAQTALIQFHS